MHGTAISASGAATGRAFGQVRPSKPVDDAPRDEQIAYLTRFVEILAEEITGVRKHADAIVEESESRIGTRMEEMSARLAQADERVGTLRAAMLGADGTGLRQAAVGLAVTLFGVMLSAAGLPW